MTPALTVYFDGGCPVCIREIGFYRRRRGADAIEWIDLDKLAPGPVAPDLDKADAMARFHVREPQGRLLSGARAFAALWRALPGLRPVGRIMGLPGIVHMLEGGYKLLLKIRALWRPEQCNTESCAVHQR